jgi:uncharacterized membrane protein YccC
MTFTISKAEWLYAAKCTLGAAICYLLYMTFPQVPFFWSIISVVLVISVENDSKLPYTRIKANLVGGLIGLALFFIPAPIMLSLCMGVFITVMAGILLKLGVSTRTAMAAMLIVLVQEKQTHSWTVALERIGCVAAGCLVGLIITVAFSYIEGKKK